MPRDGEIGTLVNRLSELSHPDFPREPRGSAHYGRANYASDRGRHIVGLFSDCERRFLHDDSTVERNETY
jgi:hypothetical protein